MDKIYLNNLGAEASSSGDFEKAEKYFRQAFELSPDDPLICFNIGFTLVKKGEKEEAVKWFDKALACASAGPDADTEADMPERGKLALDCGLACFEASLYGKAEEYYLTASEAGKENSEYWNRLGVLKFVTEKISDARDCFERAVLIDPDHIDSWYNLADAYDELGLKDKADAARKQFLNLENRKEVRP